MTVLIAGDICPIEGNRPYFQDGDVESLFKDFLSEFVSADLSIANLECPLIERQTPIVKTGPVFGESVACVNALKRAGLDVLGLANNHIMDHGGEGLRSTLEACGRVGIATVGAGANREQAKRILVREFGDLRLGIVAMAEHEFSIATQSSWGANPLDLIEFVRTVRNNREKFDYLIVLVHGGHEFQVLSPRIKNTCHFLVEMGANAVMVQHPHCLGGIEQYQNGFIVYGQGALIMDEVAHRKLKSFHEGFLVKLRISKGTPPAMEILPFAQSDPVPGLREMGPEREATFRGSLQRLSDAQTDDAALRLGWRNFCEANRHGYISTLLGHNRLLRKLNSSGLLERCLYGKRALLATRNLLCCETHREILETLLVGLDD